MWWRWAASAILILAMACAGRAKPPAEQKLPARSADAGPDRVALPEPARGLRAAVDDFLAGGGGSGDGRLVPALHALAQALRALPEARFAADAVDSKATTLTHAGPRPLEQPDVVRQAMAASLRGLTRAQVPGQATVAYERELSALAAAVDEIRPSVPVPKERESLAAALRAATNAVFLANGSPAPYALAAAPAAQPRTSAALLERARQAVAALGRSEWSSVNPAAGEALSAFADLLHARPQSPSGLEEKIADIRLQARRLTESEQTSFGPPGWIKHGLQASLEGLEQLPAARQTEAEPWLQAARTAVAAVEGQTPVTFQRAAVQDAFRTLVDALAVVTEMDRASGEGNSR